MNVAKDIATYMDGAGLATLSTNLFYGKLPETFPTTAPVAVVLHSGGLTPTDTSTTKNGNHTFQVFVVGAPGAYDAANDFILTLADGLTDQVSFATGGTKYLLLGQQGDVIPLGYDENNRPLFSANFLYGSSRAR